MIIVDKTIPITFSHPISSANILAKMNRAMSIPMNGGASNISEPIISVVFIRKLVLKLKVSR